MGVPDFRERPTFGGALPRDFFAVRRVNTGRPTAIGIMDEDTVIIRTTGEEVDLDSGHGRGLANVTRFGEAHALRHVVPSELSSNTIPRAVPSSRIRSASAQSLACRASWRAVARASSISI